MGPGGGGVPCHRELHKETRLVTGRERTAVAKGLYCGFHRKDWACKFRMG